MPDAPPDAALTGPPDDSALEAIELSTTDPVQPGWVRELVGDEPSHAHRLRSVRCAQYRGHEIEIVTTYEISIDGEPVHFHASVGDDGRLRCHESPYAALPSAVDLVKHLMDLYPDAFGGAGRGPAGGHAHGAGGSGHGEPGNGGDGDGQHGPSDPHEHR